jgi:hypothetical protein
VLVCVPSLVNLLQNPNVKSGDYIQWDEMIYCLADLLRNNAVFEHLRGLAFEQCVASAVHYNILHGKPPFLSFNLPEQDQYSWDVRSVYEKVEGDSVQSDVDIVVVGTFKDESEYSPFDNLPEPKKPKLVLGNFKVSRVQLQQPKPAYVKYLKALDFKLWDAYLLLFSLKGQDPTAEETMLNAWRAVLVKEDINITVLSGSLGRLSVWIVCVCVCVCIVCVCVFICMYVYMYVCVLCRS